MKGASCPKIEKTRVGKALGEKAGSLWLQGRNKQPGRALREAYWRGYKLVINEDRQRMEKEEKGRIRGSQASQRAGAGQEEVAGAWNDEDEKSSETTNRGLVRTRERDRWRKVCSRSDASRSTEFCDSQMSGNKQKPSVHHSTRVTRRN